MLNTLTTFEKLIQEHEVIQANVKQITSSTDNLFTLFRLHDNPARFTSYQVNILSDKRLSLKRAITSLKEGLAEHHHREEEVIHSLVGEPLMQIINREHEKITEILEEIDWILLNVGPTGILFNSSFLKQKVDTLSRRLNAICLKEDSVLDLLIKISEN
jgi:hypothetical protein